LSNRLCHEQKTQEEEEEAGEEEEEEAGAGETAEQQLSCLAILSGC